ncbi:MAG: hypothetical protein U5K76_15410 [Woeseiaceae bacterium]|nr:hypothetical protein [Woeseiaceae bacterium]
MTGKSPFRAGFVYFLLVFAVGFALAPIRELWAIPHFGERMGELLEMPFMLLAIVLAAGFVVRRYRIPAELAPRMTIGTVGLLCLLATELSIVTWVRGFTLDEYVTARDPVSGGIYLGLLLLFAFMPALIRRRRA